MIFYQGRYPNFFHSLSHILYHSLSGHPPPTQSPRFNCGLNTNKDLYILDMKVDKKFGKNVARYGKRQMIDFIPWLACLWLAGIITAGENTVITGLCQTTTVVTTVANRHKLENSAKSCVAGIISLSNAMFRHSKHNLGWSNTLYRFIQQRYCCTTSDKIRSVRALSIRGMFSCVLILTSLP